MKKVNVTMLPTDEASVLHMGVISLIQFSKPIRSESGIRFPQHLYFTSDDEIKEGDWLIGRGDDESFNEVWQHDGNGYIADEDLKIIATTDSSLIGYDGWKKEMQSEDYGAKIIHTNSKQENHMLFRRSVMPQLGLIGESFIKAFVKAEGKITEVMIEMEEILGDEGIIAHVAGEDEWKPKLREDGTVIVHQSKVYSRQEVILLCESAFKTAWKEGTICPEESGDIDFQDWLKENLI